MQRQLCVKGSGRHTCPFAQLPMQSGKVPPHGGNVVVVVGAHAHAAPTTPQPSPAVPHEPLHNGGTAVSHGGSGMLVVVVVEAGVQLEPAGS